MRLVGPRRSSGVGTPKRKTRTGRCQLEAEKFRSGLQFFLSTFSLAEAEFRVNERTVLFASRFGETSPSSQRFTRVGPILC
jgi:hypothetical protein